jgi:hypothetical protein
MFEVRRRQVDWRGAEELLYNFFPTFGRYRAVGSSQNVSMVNTVLCTIFGEAFGEFADAIEAGGSPASVSKKALDDHSRVVFNGDAYSADWHVEAGKRGVYVGQIDRYLQSQLTKSHTAESRRSVHYSETSANLYLHISPISPL